MRPKTLRPQDISSRYPSPDRTRASRCAVRMMGLPFFFCLSCTLSLRFSHHRLRVQGMTARREKLLLFTTRQQHPPSFLLHDSNTRFHPSVEMASLRRHGGVLLCATVLVAAACVGKFVVFWGVSLHGKVVWWGEELRLLAQSSQSCTCPGAD